MLAPLIAAIFGLVPSLVPVRGSCLVADGGMVTVGLLQGGVACFDAETLRPNLRIEPIDTGDTLDAVWLNGRPWWIQRGQRAIFFRSITGSVDRVALRAEPKRLGAWLGRVVAQFDPGIELIDPATLQECPVSECFPPEISGLLNQSYFFCCTGRSSSYVALVRPANGSSNKELISAWRWMPTDTYRLLGHYSVDVCDLDRGAVRNLLLGQEGILGLSEDESIAIPFLRENWEPLREQLRIAPKRPQAACLVGSTAYWGNGRGLIALDIESGETDQFFERESESKIVSLASDEGIVYCLTTIGLQRFEPEEPPAEFIALSPKNDGQPDRVREAIEEASEPLDRGLTPTQFVDKLRSLTDLSIPRVDPAFTTLEPIAGDLLVVDGEPMLYAGGTQAFAWVKGTVVNFDLNASTRIDAYSSRMAGEGRATDPASSGTHMSPLSEVIRLVGVGKPNPRLGTNLYVKVCPEDPHDKPYLPAHFRLQSLMNNWLGTPYLWGGQSLSGTDCSGFVTAVYRDLGIRLPRHSQAIARAPFGRVVTDELNYGDVLVYPRPQHVAIYVGQGRTMETLLHQGVGVGTVWRRNRAYVRRFIEP